MVAIFDRMLFWKKKNDLHAESEMHKREVEGMFSFETRSHIFSLASAA